MVTLLVDKTLLYILVRDYKNLHFKYIQIIRKTFPEILTSKDVLQNISMKLYQFSYFYLITSLKSYIQKQVDRDWTSINLPVATPR